MTRFLECLLAGVLVTAYVGCEPRPVVVDPDDDGTTIIEDDADADVDLVPDGTTTESETGVDVNIGGGQQADPGASGTNTSGNTGTNQTGAPGTTQ